MIVIIFLNKKLMQHTDSEC